MSNIVYIFLGGGLGSLTRYSLTLLLPAAAFPIATLGANVLASILAGGLAGAYAQGQVTDAQRLLWVTGFCGGFSTFSTFSVETMRLIEGGNWPFALLNILLNLFGCLLGVYLALRLTAG